MSPDVPTSRVVTFLVAYHELQELSVLTSAEASPWKFSTNGGELALQMETHYKLCLCYLVNPVTDITPVSGNFRRFTFKTKDKRTALQSTFSGDGN